MLQPLLLPAIINTLI